MRVASVILFHSSLGVLYKGKYETRVSTRKQKMFRFMDFFDDISQISLLN